MKKIAMIILCVAVMVSDSACGKTAAVEDYLSRSDVQSEIASLDSSMTALGLKLDVSGDGSKLIYSYTFINTSCKFLQCPTATAP